MTAWDANLVLGLALSALMGTTLGALGGGGSILTVPILVYVLGLGPKTAIATSLFVVSVTSAVSAIQHARAGNVRYKAAAWFAGPAMAGAYAGGRLADWLPDTVLLLLFSALMLVTGVAMLRSRQEADVHRASVGQELPVFKIAVEGLVVGAVTGLVGAGGGFLVVPALVLFGGFSMKDAVGTSLFIIALKSLAGLAGQLDHTVIDWSLALAVSTAAVMGALVGTRMTALVSSALLKRVFAALVLGTSALMMLSQVPAHVRHAIFVERWPFWAGGLAIGLFVLAFLLVAKKPLGVSTGFEDACAALVRPDARRSWRLPFLAGIVAGGLVAALLAGGPVFSTTMGIFDDTVSASSLAKAVVLTLGGVLIGFGARLAGGCTSGHSILGIAQLSRASLVATLSFMGGGFVIANLVFRIFKG